MFHVLCTNRTSAGFTGGGKNLAILVHFRRVHEVVVLIHSLLEVLVDDL